MIGKENMASINPRREIIAVFSARERTWHISDRQGQILALA